MILYTPLPMELVLEGIDKERCLAEIEIHGVKVLVEDSPAGQKVINKVLSTDPNVFLNPLFQPGNIVDYQEPIIKSNI